MNLLKRLGVALILAEGLVLIGGMVGIVRVTSEHPTVVAFSMPPQPAPTLPLNVAQLSAADKAGHMVCFAVNSLELAKSLAENDGVGCFLLTPGGDVYEPGAAQAIQDAARMPVFLAIDEEGGSVARLDREQFDDDSARAMGGMASSDVVVLGKQMGESIRAVGANLDFAPVLDIDDPNNEAIGYYDRAFSTHPTVITRKAGAFANGLRAANVIPTFKHFPGLGRATGTTSGNTDTGSATTPDLTSLRALDLVPYGKLLPGPSRTSVMVGNQIVPGLTNGQPASLSSATYDLLRNDYHFQGVAFTDSLSALAIGETPEQAVVDALKAGADLPLVTVYSADEAHVVATAIIAAINDGSLTNSRINETLARVETLRATLPKD